MPSLTMDYSEENTDNDYEFFRLNKHFLNNSALLQGDSKDLGQKSDFHWNVIHHVGSNRFPPAI